MWSTDIICIEKDSPMRLCIDYLGFDKVMMDNSVGAPVLFGKKKDSLMRIYIYNLGFDQVMIDNK